jgi:hypothetical protein
MPDTAQEAAARRTLAPLADDFRAAARQHFRLHHLLIVGTASLPQLSTVLEPIEGAEQLVNPVSCTTVSWNTTSYPIAAWWLLTRGPEIGASLPEKLSGSPWRRFEGFFFGEELEAGGCALFHRLGTTAWRCADALGAGGLGGLFDTFLDPAEQWLMLLFGLAWQARSPALVASRWTSPPGKPRYQLPVDRLPELRKSDTDGQDAQLVADPPSCERYVNRIFCSGAEPRRCRA